MYAHLVCNKNEYITPTFQCGALINLSVQVKDIDAFHSPY